MNTTYNLTITNSLANYMPEYQTRHDSIESANEEYRRVLRAITEVTDNEINFDQAGSIHNGQIYGSDGSHIAASKR